MPFEPPTTLLHPAPMSVDIDGLMTDAQSKPIMSRPVPNALRFAAWTILVLLVLVVLYVLSVGPTARMVEDGRRITPETFYKCYGPIMRMTESVPIANRLIASYLDAWGVTLIVVNLAEGGHQVHWDYWTVDPS